MSDQVFLEVACSATVVHDALCYRRMMNGTLVQIDEGGRGARHIFEIVIRVAHGPWSAASATGHRQMSDDHAILLEDVRCFDDLLDTVSCSIVFT